MSKEKKAMLCGMLANIIYMIGDWLLDAFGTESVEIGLAAETGFSNIAMWRLALSILAGCVGVYLMIPAVNAFMGLSERTCRKENKVSCFMTKMFRVGMYTAIIAGSWIHTMCCMIGVIWKSALAAGTSETIAAEITNTSTATFIGPFFVLYLVLEFATCIPYMYKVLSGELKLKKVAVVCCSLVTLIIFSVTELFGSTLINDIFSARESFGWVLMFLMGWIALDRIAGD